MRRDATSTALTARQRQAIEALLATGDVTIATQSARAADATLTKLLQLRELATLEQRVTALEAGVGGEQR